MGDVEMANEKVKAAYYTVIKYSGQLRTPVKRREGSQMPVVFITG